MSRGPVCITIRVADPAMLAALLESHRIRVTPIGDALEVALAGDRLAIRPGPPAHSLELEACRGPGHAGGRWPAGEPGLAGDSGAPMARLAAIGYATVDHARFARDHGLPRLDAAPHDDLLGAYAWRSAGIERLFVLEPSTEGRLAGALARAGEGPLVVYLASGSTIATTGGDRGGGTPLGVTGTLLVRPAREGAANLIVT